ncbi:STAS domain-containing protein [Bengtsoniella intestinalis]|uniref:STAS domain-containing protein n=1 Tax=Bengtsoniella intestinalis TaxID=3073143 RepID=UPI00391F60D2
MTIETTQQDQQIIVTVKGRIDTNTSPQLQSAVLAAFQQSKAVELDLREVDYVSSAGLRVFLIGQKTAASKGGTMTLAHVQPTVMQVFTAVGLAPLLTFLG